MYRPREQLVTSLKSPKKLDFCIKQYSVDSGVRLVKRKILGVLQKVTFLQIDEISPMI